MKSPFAKVMAAVDKNLTVIEACQTASKGKGQWALISAVERFICMGVAPDEQVREMGTGCTPVHTLYSSKTLLYNTYTVY